MSCSGYPGGSGFLSGAAEGLLPGEAGAATAVLAAASWEALAARFALTYLPSLQGLLQLYKYGRVTSVLQ